MAKFERIYNVDESFFKKIDTEEKAYILGFMYADGCNHHNPSKCNYSISITQLTQDVDILEKINNAMTSDYPIHTYVQKENNKEKSVLLISSKDLSQDLCKLGCSEAKTFSIRFPNENQYFDDNLMCHFIRGYFDGDGCI